MSPSMPHTICRFPLGQAVETIKPGRRHAAGLLLPHSCRQLFSKGSCYFRVSSLPAAASASAVSGLLTHLCSLLAHPFSLLAHLCSILADAQGPVTQSVHEELHGRFVFAPPSSTQLDCFCMCFMRGVQCRTSDASVMQKLVARVRRPATHSLHQRWLWKCTLV